MYAPLVLTMSGHITVQHLMMGEVGQWWWANVCWCVVACKLLVWVWPTYGLPSHPATPFSPRLLHPQPPGVCDLGMRVSVMCMCVLWYMCDVLCVCVYVCVCECVMLMCDVYVWVCGVWVWLGMCVCIVHCGEEWETYMGRWRQPVFLSHTDWVWNSI